MKSNSPGNLSAHAAVLFASLSASSAAVVTHTLPLPFRTSQEYVNVPPAYYPDLENDPGTMSYPLDFNGDGDNEFGIAFSTPGDFTLRLYSARSTNQIITTLASEVIFGMERNPYAIPGPPGIEVGPTPPGTGIKWGVFNPAPEADLLGLGPMAGYYVLGSALGGQSGYYSSRWSRLLPADWDYLPMRFELEDGVHYGYLRMGYETSSYGTNLLTYAVLRGWAWESEPGVPITVIPEPQSALLCTFTLLALGRRRSAPASRLATGRSQALSANQFPPSIL